MVKLWLCYISGEDELTINLYDNLAVFNVNFLSFKFYDVIYFSLVLGYQFTFSYT